MMHLKGLYVHHFKYLQILSEMKDILHLPPKYTQIEGGWWFFVRGAFKKCIAKISFSNEKNETKNCINLSFFFHHSLNFLLSTYGIHGKCPFKEIISLFGSNFHEISYVTVFENCAKLCKSLCKIVKKLCKTNAFFCQFFTILSQFFLLQSIFFQFSD